MITPAEYVLQLKTQLYFPHHVHMGGEKNVEPGERLSIIQLLDMLAGEIPMEES